MKIYILKSDKRTKPQAYASREHAEFHRRMRPGAIEEVEVCQTDPLNDLLVALHSFHAKADKSTPNSGANP